MQIIDTWQRSASRLIAVAAGREAAELVVQNCHLVNVNSREILDGWEVAVVKGRFAYVGPNATHCVGANTTCLLYTSPSPRDRPLSRMPSSA